MNDKIIQRHNPQFPLSTENLKEENEPHLLWLLKGISIKVPADSELPFWRHAPEPTPRWNVFQQGYLAVQIHNQLEAPTQKNSGDRILEAYIPLQALTATSPGMTTQKSKGDNPKLQQPEVTGWSRKLPHVSFRATSLGKDHPHGTMACGFRTYNG